MQETKQSASHRTRERESRDGRQRTSESQNRSESHNEVGGRQRKSEWQNRSPSENKRVAENQRDSRRVAADQGSTPRSVGVARPACQGYSHETRRYNDCEYKVRKLRRWLLIRKYKIRSRGDGNAVLRSEESLSLSTNFASSLHNILSYYYATIYYSSICLVIFFPIHMNIYI